MKLKCVNSNKLKMGPKDEWHGTTLSERHWIVYSEMDIKEDYENVKVKEVQLEIR